MNRLVPTFFALLLLAAGSAPGCDNPVPVAPLNNGLSSCREMREECEAPAAALGGFYEQCHETGHDNLGPACLDIYDSCLEACLEAQMSLGGAGGQGGAAAPTSAGQGGESYEPTAGHGGS